MMLPPPTDNGSLAARTDRKHAVRHIPFFGRKALVLDAAPARGGFAIPEQTPAGGLFRFGQRVQRCGGSSGRGHFLEAEIAPADLRARPCLDRP